MGNFISKAWDKLTGKTQVDAANKISQQSVDISKEQYDNWKKMVEELKAQYGELIPRIKEEWAHTFGQGSDWLEQYIDKTINGSPEQTEADNAYNQLIEMLKNPLGNLDTSQEDNIRQTYIDSLTKPIEDSEEDKKFQGLADNFINMLTAPQNTEKSNEQKTADEWNSKYLSSLANSGDVAFNAGVSELAKGMQLQNENIAKAMQNRGISSSGLNLAALGSTAADQARGVSQLQGQRVDRQNANNLAGAQFAQGLADKQRSNMLEDEDRKINKYGTAVNTADYLAQQREGKRQQQLGQYGTALDVSQTGTDRKENMIDKTIRYAGSAYDLAQGKADKGRNNILDILNLTNNYNQQQWNNLMSLLGSQGAIINGSAPSNYAQALNGLAQSYSDKAAGQAGLAGQALGGLAQTNGAKNILNTIGNTQAVKTVGNGLQAIGSLLGLGWL